MNGSWLAGKALFLRGDTSIQMVFFFSIVMFLLRPSWAIVGHQYSDDKHEVLPCDLLGGFKWPFQGLLVTSVCGTKRSLGRSWHTNTKSWKEIGHICLKNLFCCHLVFVGGWWHWWLKDHERSKGWRCFEVLPNYIQLVVQRMEDVGFFQGVSSCLHSSKLT